MTAGADVIVNRNASRLAAIRGLRRAVVDAADQGHARIHETHDLDDLAEVTRGIAARGTGGVVLAGGDGSYMAGVSALSRAFAGRALPPIAFAPGGTVCTVARNFGVRGRGGHSAGRVVSRVCASVAKGTARTVPRPTLRVLDDAGGDRIGFIFGAGLVVRFFDAYYGRPRQGLASAATLVARIFAGTFTDSPFARQVLNPTRCSLRVDGEVHAAHDWSLVLASVVRDVGLHMLVPYRAGEALDRFHAVASGLPARALGAQLPRALAGRPLLGEPRVDVLARSLRLGFEGEDGGYVLDGDVFRTRAVKIEAGPVLSVLV